MNTTTTKRLMAAFSLTTVLAAGPAQALLGGGLGDVVNRPPVYVSENCPYAYALPQFRTKELELRGGIGATTTVPLLTHDLSFACYQRYQYGTVYWSADTGAHVVYGAIGARYRQLGAQRGSGLGSPWTDELTTISGRGRFNDFQQGGIVWSPATGAKVIPYGPVRNKWGAFNWDAGFLGFPTTDEFPTAYGRGRYQHYEGGSIYYSPASGTHEVHGDIRARWASQGWENSLLGYPITDERALQSPWGTLGMARKSVFQGGTIYWYWYGCHRPPIQVASPPGRPVVCYPSYTRVARARIVAKARTLGSGAVIPSEQFGKACAFNGDVCGTCNYFPKVETGATFPNFGASWLICDGPDGAIRVADTTYPVNY